MNKDTLGETIIGALVVARWNSDGTRAGAVEVTGGGTLVLNSFNVFSGIPIISGGTLEFAAFESAGSSFLVDFNPGTGGTLRLDSAAMNGDSATAASGLSEEPCARRKRASHPPAATPPCSMRSCASKCAPNDRFPR